LAKLWEEVGAPVRNDFKKRPGVQKLTGMMDINIDPIVPEQSSGMNITPQS